MKLSTVQIWSVVVFLLSSLLEYAVEQFAFWDELYYRFDFSEGLIIGLFLFSIFTFVTTVILKFLKESVFDSWWKFARIYIPVSFVLILISPGTGGSGLINVDAELITWWLSSLFFIISIILIIVKSRSK